MSVIQAKKHTYEMVINSVPTGKNAKTYRYKYGSTKGICVSVSKGAAKITVQSGADYLTDDIVSLGNRLFFDAVRKVLLVHLLLFSENIEVSRFSVRIDDCEETVVPFEKASPPIYSLVVSKLQRKIPTEWNNDAVIETLLNMSKSQYDSRIASLFAYICAKNKMFETERFIYLWMAMNGIYVYYSKTQKPDKVLHECEQIKSFMSLLNLGSCTIKKKVHGPIAHNISGILCSKSPEPITYESLTSGCHTALATAITSVLNSSGKKHDITPYGYLLLQLPYYYRCKLFHANKPLALFSSSDDSELTVIRALNQVLEDFLDKNLYKWFDEKFLESLFETSDAEVKK